MTEILITLADVRAELQRQKLVDEPETGETLSPPMTLRFPALRGPSLAGDDEELGAFCVRVGLVRDPNELLSEACTPTQPAPFSSRLSRSR